MSVSLSRVSLTLPSDLVEKLDAAAAGSDYRTRSALSAKLLRDALNAAATEAVAQVCAQ